MPDLPGSESVSDRWDRTLSQLSVRTNRQIIVSLLEVPEERRLPLPEAARPTTDSTDRDKFEVELKHQHLPTLANAGYVRWEQDPFCVQRGPRFEEPAAVMRILLASSDQLPETMIQGSLIGAHAEQ